MTEEKTGLHIHDLGLTTGKCLRQLVWAFRNTDQLSDAQVRKLTDDGKYLEIPPSESRLLKRLRENVNLNFRIC